MDGRAKQYSTIKYALSLIETGYIILLLFLFAGLGWSGILAGAIGRIVPFKILIIPAYLLAACILYYLLNFPLNLYHSYILEHKFGLARQAFAGWLADQFKSAVIAYVILLIIFEAFYFVLQKYPGNWWMIITVFWIFFSLILSRLVPIIIIPLFFKYKKLSDDNLRLRIIELAKKTGVEILDVFEIDFSKKTLKANAAFVGWGKTKRVILADTLKEKYSHDEIAAILAHEFAHYKLKHLIKLIFVNCAITAWAFYLIFKTDSGVLSMFGLSSLSDIAAFPIVCLYFVLFGVITRPLENFISRVMERNADRMALEVTANSGAFVSMMEKLSAQNLADRFPHPLIKFFFFDHPPIDERIRMAKS